MTNVLPYPMPKLSDADVFLVCEADEVVRAELDRAATFICGRLWEVSLLRGPGNQDMRERRVKEALLDLYYDMMIETARLDAGQARMKEINDTRPVGEKLHVEHSNDQHA